MQQTRLTFRFSVVQSLYWCACCVVFSFLTPYYQSLGYGAFTIGVLSTIVSVSSTVAQPLWGLYCDRSGRIKAALLASVLISLPFGWLLTASGRSFPLLALSLFMIGVTYLSMPSIIDAWILKLVNQGRAVNYSLARGFGSLFFAAASIVFGAVLDRTGMWVISPAFIIGAAALFAVSFFIPAPAADARQGRGTGHGQRTLCALLRNRQYVVLLVSITTLFTGVTAIDMTFYPVLLKELGGGNTELGAGLFLMASSEVPVMLVYNRLAKRFRERDMICFSLFSYVVKCLLIAASPNVLTLVLAQGLQAFSFGLMLPAVVNYINAITEPATMVTAQVLYSAATYGVGAIIGSFAGGAIADALGVRPMMFILFSFVALSAVLFTALTARKGDAAEIHYERPVK